MVQLYHILKIVHVHVPGMYHGPWPKCNCIHIFCHVDGTIVDGRRASSYGFRYLTVQYRTALSSWEYCYYQASMSFFAVLENIQISTCRLVKSFHQPAIKHRTRKVCSWFSLLHYRRVPVHLTRAASLIGFSLAKSIVFLSV